MSRLDAGAKAGSMRASNTVGKGFVAGAVGGLIATVAMDAFQKLSLEATRKAEDVAEGGHRYTRQQETQLSGYQQAHEDTAERLVQAVGGGSLTRAQKQVAAPATHYIFGALCGGVYGMLAERWKPASFGFGTAFGVSLFLGASEAVLPSLELVPSPLETPPLLHVGGLAAHAVYGATTEGVRRLVRGAL
ncbi:DUF1440 domain-containing protein [Acidipila sp. EB88]|uniref:DUF1440 domain-containing protein n=1 Tax=Acidipila sp. EB88 TaxID=2305226 RepID=UPI000F5DA859|nr:DUF1440 domain-containing protein [Acidipila sp. EB88]RRA48194.1 DUF1440 domain-containing protein [Acidipila sp. EB88]